MISLFPSGPIAKMSGHREAHTPHPIQVSFSILTFMRDADRALFEAFRKNKCYRLKASNGSY